jgi:uncharacterized protein (TIGR02246 family)
MADDLTGLTPNDRRADEDAIRELVVAQMRFLTPDVALINAKGAAAKGARRRNRRNTRVNTSIAVRTDGGWLLAASQNTTHRRFAEKLMGKLASRQIP